MTPRFLCKSHFRAISLAPKGYLNTDETRGRLRLKSASFCVQDFACTILDSHRLANVSC
jgi:hypothetical protein